MSRSVRLSTLVGALLGVLGVAALTGGLDAVPATFAEWADPFRPGLLLALLAGGAAGGAVLAQSLAPRRRRKSKKAADGGPGWSVVAAVLAIVAIVYGKGFGEPVRAAARRVVALILGDGAA